MARLHSSIPPPTLSVLDRLLDDDPDYQGIEQQPDYRTGLTRLKDFVLRDLQWILNARIGRVVPEDGRGGEVADPLEGTVACLGLPDITNLDFKNAREREFLRRRIVDAVARFEPRLDFVTVTVSEGAVRGQTRFQIQARLKVDPEPLKLSFDATVVWRNRMVTIH